MLKENIKLSELCKKFEEELVKLRYGTDSLYRYRKVIKELKAYIANEIYTLEACATFLSEKMAEMGGFNEKGKYSKTQMYYIRTVRALEEYYLYESFFRRKNVLTPMVNAFREHDMKIGFYHSLLDWHHPEYTVDKFHPRRHNPEFPEQSEKRDLNKYVDYLWGQTRELLTGFGKIDILWYDFSVEASDRFLGKGKNEWKSDELIKMIREIQPEIIINDRLQIDQDVKTPEQYQPREWVKVDGKPVVWEACQTFSGSWGYHRDESTWKSVDMLVQMLIDTVSKGGNLLLNVGPTGRGEFDERALDCLSGMGKWMKNHGRSIYGCTQAPDEFAAPKDCRLTYNPDKNRLYIHMFSYPFGGFFMDGKEICDRIEYAQFLNDASEVLYFIEGETVSFKIPVIKPNVTVPVIEVFLK